MSDLLARLITAGMPTNLIAEVAMEIARADAVRRQEALAEEKSEKKRADAARRQREFKAKKNAEVTQGNAQNALPALVSVTCVTETLSLSPNDINSNPHTHTHENITPREDENSHVLAWMANQTALLATKAKSTRGKPMRPMPDGWEPVLTPAAQKIVDDWPPSMFDQQLAAFRDHAADKGRTSKDWQAAFRTWVANANKWKPNNERSQTNRNGSSNVYSGQRGGKFDGFGSALDEVIHAGRSSGPAGPSGQSDDASTALLLPFRSAR